MPTSTKELVEAALDLNSTLGMEFDPEDDPGANIKEPDEMDEEDIKKLRRQIKEVALLVEPGDRLRKKTREIVEKCVASHRKKNGNQVKVEQKSTENGKRGNPNLPSTGKVKRLIAFLIPLIERGELRQASIVTKAIEAFGNEIAIGTIRTQLGLSRSYTAKENKFPFIVQKDEETGVLSFTKQKPK